MIGRTISHYEITEKLGEGGMGVVYKARDSRLKRFVALKVLPPEKVTDLERKQRFIQEAQSASALNHPNIVTVHDIGQSDGVDFIAMEYVEGETLGELIGTKGLKLNEALKYAIQIADALAKAHEAGIVHRDLKPGNVMVTPDRRVKVLDFGLAKLTETAPVDREAETVTAMPSTDLGMIVGTVAYMSPEQAEGKKVDARSDIFSFGSVLYEMLTGRRAFRRDNPALTLAAVLHLEPPALPEGTPGELERIVARCLRKDPARRFQTAADLRVALEELKEESESASWRLRRPSPVKRRRWLWTAGVATIAVLAAFPLYRGAAWVYRSRVDAIDSLAVLPFVNAGGDPNAEYLSDGITESLINSLSQLPNLKVMSRDSAFHYKGKETDVRTIGKELGVRAVFKGRVVQRGDSLDVSAELINAGDNSHIWGQQYSRKSADIFALQGDIAREITTALRTHLTGKDQKRMAKSYTANPEAYQLYLQGLYWSNKRSESSYKKAVGYFQQAIDKDPRYALAYASLADAYSIPVNNSYAIPKENYPKAKAAALKALEIDDSLAEGHASLAFVKALYDWDWSGAEAEYRRAMELNPDYSRVHESRGNVLRHTGAMEESVAEERRALELDPFSLPVNRGLGYALYDSRQYALAIEQELKTLELDPNYHLARSILGRAYLEEALYKEAIAEFEKVLAIAPNSILLLADLGRAYALAGRKAEAKRVIDQLMERSKQTYVFPKGLAMIYAGLGQKDEAFEWLEESYEDRSLGSAMALKSSPVFDPLRSDPRFTDLLRRLNLQP